MAGRSKDEIVWRTVTVPVPLERAFAVFIDGMTSWWPRENTFGKEAFEGVVVERRPGGRWFERANDGGEEEWGRVLAWEPPDRLVLSWQITPAGQPEPDPAKASEVEVRFAADGSSRTRVDLVHSAFSRHGEAEGEVWRAAMDSPEGWTKFLARYEATVSSRQV